MAVAKAPYVADLQHYRVPTEALARTLPRERDPGQGGRPALFVFTTRGYLLITLHASNDHNDSVGNNAQQTRDALQRAFEQALEQFTSNQQREHGGPPPSWTFDHRRVLVAGDFNDPGGSIHNKNALVLRDPRSEPKGQQFPDVRLGMGLLDEEPVRSCCYNFNSSCDPEATHPDTNLRFWQPHAIETLKSDPKYMSRGGECLVLDNKATGEIMGQGKPRPLHEKYGDTNRGTIETYRFGGDYVMGVLPNSSAATYRPPEFVHLFMQDQPRRGTVSLESDHELVYADFQVHMT